jgi:hypothetical protein
VQPYTLDRKFLPQDVIDEFDSIIWTERYYGDSEVELVVPATSEMIRKLPEGIFLALPESDEVMILETATIEEGKLKLVGMSLLPWMNNRFIRTSPLHEVTSWNVQPGTPGWVLWAIIYNFCMNSPYTNGSIDMGIPNPQNLIIPGLRLIDYDKTGADITVAIPFGPVYDEMRKIAVTYEVGMQIILEYANDTSYSLGYRNYRGLNRTSNQTDRPTVRFSPQMDSLTNIKELRSIAALKTLVYAFASNNPGKLATTPGIASRSEQAYTGFDLRAQMIFPSDIDPTLLTGDKTKALVDLLNSRAKDELNASPFIKAVDGEIVPTNQFQYGVHYNLGDVIEVQGNSEIVQTSRVTEYIRAQDEAGERAYPTVAMLD